MYRLVIIYFCSTWKARITIGNQPPTRSPHMKNETIKQDWNDIKTKMKDHFVKLSDSNIESLKGNLEHLTSKLQEVYGYAREQAEKEFNSFKQTLHEATEPDKAPVVAAAATVTPIK